MASEGIVNRLMQSLNIFILLFEIFFLSLLRIAVILFSSSILHRFLFLFFPSICAFAHSVIRRRSRIDPLSLYVSYVVRPSASAPPHFAT